MKKAADVSALCSGDCSGEVEGKKRGGEAGGGGGPVGAAPGNNGGEGGGEHLLRAPGEPGYGAASGFTWYPSFPLNPAGDNAPANDKTGGVDDSIDGEAEELAIGEPNCE